MAVIKKQRRLIAILVLIALAFSLIMPAAVSAGFLKKLIRFIVSVPEKITRPLGPLAPIAQIWLMGKVPKINKIWLRAKRIKNFGDSIDAQKKNLRELKQVYRDQAKILRERAKLIRKQRVEIRYILTDCGPGSLRVYMNEYLKLEKMAEALDKAASRLEQRTDSLKMKDVIRLFSRNALQAVMGDLKKVIVTGTTGDMPLFANPNDVKRFIAGGSLDVNSVIRAVISGDVERLVKKNKLPRGINMNGLKDRIAERMRVKVKERGKYIRKNWSKELDKTFQEITNMSTSEINRATQDIPEGPIQMAEGVDCVKKEKPKPAIKTDTGKVRGPKGTEFELSVSEKDSPGEGYIIIKSNDLTLKMGSDGRLSGKYSIKGSRLHTNPPTDFSETGTLVQDPGTPPVSNWPITVNMHQNFQRTTLTGPQAGKVEKGTLTQTPFSGNISPSSEGSGLMVVGGSIAKWEITGSSYSARSW